MSTWLTTAELAELAAIDDRRARKALVRAFQNAKPWRGALISVRLAPSAGGPRGLGYEVHVDSLPFDLQQSLKNRLSPTTLPLFAELTPQRGAERDWYLRILGPLLAMPRGQERAAAIEALAVRKDLTDWRGRPTELTTRTIHRRLKAYRDEGALAFAPRARADKGHAKVLISLMAEQAIPFDDETWEGIANDLRNYVRGHWKKGATLKLIRAHTNFKFRELIEAAGFDHCHTLSDSTFIVPRRFIEAERIYRHVHTLQHDRKRYEDNRFRTTRTRAGMMPMDWIIGDVHPLDIISTREDGSTAHARLLGWLDCATNRMRFDLILCEPGTGIRNADLVKSFCHMLNDPTWGMPKTLYIDNGSEYRFADNLNDAMQLVAQLRGGDGRATRVVHARPYNAAAKPIESMFAALERALQDVPGHTGGDRMNKKTERVGRPTKAFSGTLKQLNDIVAARLTLYENEPMRGALNGRSPRQVYEAAIENGWQPVSVDQSEIYTVFATDEVRSITKGVVSFGGRNWCCDELTSYHEKRIVLRVPRFWQPDKIALLHFRSRELIGLAEPIGAFRFDDPAGAQFSNQVDKARRNAVRALDCSAPNIDTVAETQRFAATILPLPVAAPIANSSVSKEASAIAGLLAETPTARADRQRDTNIKAQKRQSAALDNALHALKGSK